MDAKKLALVTGANKGIGLEISRQLARQGVTVLLGTRDENKGQEAAGRLRDEGLDVHLLPLDQTRPESIAAAAAKVERQYGRLDILVNNAAILTTVRVWDAETGQLLAAFRGHESTVHSIASGGQDGTVRL